MAQPPVTLDEVDTVGNIVQVGRGRSLGTLGLQAVVSFSMGSPYKTMTVWKPEYCSEYLLSTQPTAARLAWLATGAHL